MGMVRVVVAAVLIGGLGKTAQAQNPNSPSFYVQALIMQAEQASAAVSCGLRPPAWGASVREKIRATISTHAGSPIDNPHDPSDAERNIALRSLERSGDAGRRTAENAYSCNVIRQMALTNLDDIEDEATDLWPIIPQ